MGTGSHWQIMVRHGLPMAVQAGGAGLGFLIVILVSHRFGIESQGRFGLLKGWSDAIGAILMLGLPQAFLHIAYHGDVPLARLRGFAERYCAWLMLSAVVCAVIAVIGATPWLAWAILAAPVWVYLGLVRSLALRTAGTLGFAWLTASPALFLFAFMAVLAELRLEAFGPALLASAVACWLTARALLLRAGIGSERSTQSLGLAAVNRHAILQNACPASQTALLLSLAVALSVSTEGVGRISFALVFAQLFALAASFAAPAIYDAAARSTGLPNARIALRRALRMLVFAMPAMVVLAILVVPALVSLLFDESYASATRACQVMAIAGLLMLANRLAATVLQALGRFQELTLQAILRLLASLLLAGVAISWAMLPDALAVALALLLSEALLGLRMYFVMRPWLALTPGA